MATSRNGRSRLHLTIALIVIILLGLGSRKYASFVPKIFGHYAGDAFWAMAAYVGVVLLAQGISYRSAVSVALTIAFGVEFSQLYHASWIDSARNSLPGRLFLGSGFDPADLIAYGVGVLLGVIMDFVLHMRPERSAGDVDPTSTSMKIHNSGASESIDG